MLNGNDLELLSAYLDGALSEVERAALEARLQNDAELRRELARLRATVDLIRTLPTLSSPRPLTLTPRMVHRPSILTSAAFSALSAAAAIILLVIGAALFTTRPSTAPALSAARDVAALPTSLSLPQDQLNAPESGGANNTANSVAPSPLVDNFQTTLQKGTIEIAQQSSGVLGFAVPTGAPQSTQAPMLYASVPLTETLGTEELQADASVAQSQQEAATDQEQRTQAQPIAPPSAAMDGAAAQAPVTEPTLALPTATLVPTKTATLLPTATASPTNTPSAMPSLTPSPIPTIAPTLVPIETTQTNTSTIGVGLIVAALILFGVALVTTILRRRS